MSHKCTKLIILITNLFEPQTESTDNWLSGKLSSSFKMFIYVYIRRLMTDPQNMYYYYFISICNILSFSLSLSFLIANNLSHSQNPPFCFFSFRIFLGPFSSLFPSNSDDSAYPSIFIVSCDSAASTTSFYNTTKLLCRWIFLKLSWLANWCSIISWSFFVAFNNIIQTHFNLIHFHYLFKSPLWWINMFYILSFRFNLIYIKNAFETFSSLTRVLNYMKVNVFLQNIHFFSNQGEETKI